MLVLLLIFIVLVKSVLNQLVIQACCGDTQFCTQYSQAEDLFGVACCANTAYNTYSQICCAGVVRERNQGGGYAELCCGTEVVRYDQTCCDGVVHNVVNGDCCGKAVYSKLDKSTLCCNGTLARTSTANDVCCGNTVFDGGRTQICCGDQPSDKTQGDSCCDTATGFVPFQSSTQFCCGQVFAKNSEFACCYLRNGTELQPQGYRKDDLCCKYPFDRVYSRQAGECPA